MFEVFFKKVNAFNELTDCSGTYTFIDKDSKITFTTHTNNYTMPTYKDKVTYHVHLIKPNKEWACFDCLEGIISAGYDENTNNMRIQRMQKFMNSVEELSLFKY
jgi:hypothetical protein